MEPKPFDEVQRTIEAAIFSGNRGVISIESLMRLPTEQWEHIRGAITKQWQIDPKKPLAKCLLCKEPVFIRAQKGRNGQNLPVYRHFSEDQVNCLWKRGENLTPDNARAAQYQGQQESALHKELCIQVAALASADTRLEEIAIDTYRRLQIEKRGLWPDVYIKLADVGSFALEIQISKPFLPEISNRTIKYNKVGVSLLWIFYGIVPGVDELPQGFRDVIVSQRGNVFVLDEQAIEESIKRKTLLLQCYCRTSEENFGKPKLISLVEIKRGKFGSYFEDCLTPSLLEECKNAREKWWAPLKTRAERIRMEFEDDSFLEPGFVAAYDSLKYFVPSIIVWKQNFGKSNNAKEHLFRVFAVLFSIAGTAKFGKDKNYVTIESSLLAMLNSKLNSDSYRPYAQLFETMISRTCLNGLANRPSLRKKFDLAKQIAPNQTTIDDPIGQAAKHLFKEIFDGNIRDILIELEALPEWATPRLN